MCGPKCGPLVGQRVGRWWAKVWAASGPLIISLWIFLFLYFTISTDRNVCRNLNMFLFLVALHNQNIAWQRILISSLILSRWDYLISGSLASDCQNNNKNQIQIIIIYPEEIFNPFLDFFSMMKSEFVLVFRVAEIIITEIWFHLRLSPVAIRITIINLLLGSVFKFRQGDLW